MTLQPGDHVELRVNDGVIRGIVRERKHMDMIVMDVADGDPKSQIWPEDWLRMVSAVDQLGEIADG